MPGGVPARAGGRICQETRAEKNERWGAAAAFAGCVSRIQDDRAPPSCPRSRSCADRPELGAGGAVRNPRRRGRALRPAGRQPDRLRELQAGQPAERVGRHRAGDPTHPGLRHRHQRQSRARRSTSRSTPPRPPTSLDIYRMGYYGGNGARKVADRHAVGDAAADPAGLPDERGDRPGRLRQLGRVGLLGGARRRRLRHLLRQAHPRRHRLGGEPHRLRRARRRRRTPTCSSRPRTRPGRPTTATAATASTSAGPGRPGRAYKVSYNRPFTTRGTTPEDCAVQRRVPDGPLARAQRLRRQLLHRRRHRPQRRRRSSSTRSSCRSGTTSTGPAQQRANVEAARDAGVQPRLLQRQRDLLEDPLGEQHRRLRHRPTARWSATRRPTPTRRSIRNPTPGPAPGATRASARRPTAAGPRTR